MNKLGFMDANGFITVQGFDLLEGRIDTGNFVGLNLILKLHKESSMHRQNNYCQIFSRNTCKNIRF